MPHKCKHASTCDSSWPLSLAAYATKVRASNMSHASKWSVAAGTHATRAPPPLTSCMVTAPATRFVLPERWARALSKARVASTSSPTIETHSPLLIWKDAPDTTGAKSSSVIVRSRTCMVDGGIVMMPSASSSSSSSSGRKHLPRSFLGSTERGSSGARARKQ